MIRYEMDSISRQLYIARARREISQVVPEQRDSYLAEREAAARIEWRTLCQRDDIKHLDVTDSYADGSGGASIQVKQFKDPLSKDGPLVFLKYGGRLSLCERDGTRIWLEPDTQELLQRYFATGKINALLDRLSRRKTPLFDQKDAEAFASRYYHTQTEQENKFVNLLLNPLREAAAEAGALNPRQAELDLDRLEHEWRIKARSVKGELFLGLIKL